MAFILVVVAIALVMTVLTTTLFHVSLDNVSTSARMVGQNQALQAAEAGVDSAYQQIEASTSLAAMPCASVTGSLGSAPGTSTYTVTFTYYATLATQLSPLACTPSSSTNPSLKTARGVKLTSVGRDLADSATVQSAANIATPDSTSPFNESIFVNGGLNLQGGGAFVGGINNIYLNGALTCQGGAAVDGSVVVFGKVKTAGDCSIAGELTATTSITIGGSAVVGGTITSTCSPSQTCTPGIAVSGTPTISGSMYAKSTITVTTNWLTTYEAFHTVTVGGTEEPVQYTINQDMTALVPPPKKTFPHYDWTATAWSAAGYVIEPSTPAKCTTVTNDLAAISTATTPVVIYTTCKVTLPTIRLSHSLAIVSTAKITLKNSSTITTAGGQHLLYLDVPATSLTSGKTCSTSHPTITLSGTIGTTVPTFIYSPCHVKISGNTTIKSGKVYAGSQLTIDGSITMGSVTFTPPGQKSVPGNPSVGVVYERELS